MALAGSAEEVGKIAKLSERLGKATRATLKLLGRGALAIAATATSLFFWLMTALCYLYAVARSCRRFGEKMARVRLRRPRVPVPPANPFSRSVRKRPAWVPVRQAA